MPNFSKEGQLSETIEADAVGPLIKRLARGRDRFLVAIAGPPGSGKSTLAKRLCQELDTSDEPTIIVPLDGFHYDNSVLETKGLLSRKGAPDSFDVEGFGVMLQRLAAPRAEVAIPVFDRAMDISRAGATIVEPWHRVLLVEGNYLLLDEAPWRDFAILFDMSICIEVALVELERRLVKRWLDSGFSRDASRTKVMSNDIPNAKRVLECSHPAEYLVRNSRSSSILRKSG